MIYNLHFADLLPYWDVLVRGFVFTVLLTFVSTLSGVLTERTGRGSGEERLLDNMATEYLRGRGKSFRNSLLRLVSILLSNNS